MRVRDDGRDWEAWRDVTGQPCARLLKSSPPVVLRAPGIVELADQMIAAERQLDAGTYWPHVLSERQT